MSEAGKIGSSVRHYLKKERATAVDIGSDGDTRTGVRKYARTERAPRETKRTFTVK